MPWRVKRQLILMACGFIALTLSSIIVIRHKSLDTTVLGWIGILGGVAIILTNAPSNGNGDH